LTQENNIKIEVVKNHYININMDFFDFPDDIISEIICYLPYENSRLVCKKFMIMADNIEAMKPATSFIKKNFKNTFGEYIATTPDRFSFVQLNNNTFVSFCLASSNNNPKYLIQAYSPQFGKCPYINFDFEKSRLIKTCQAFFTKDTYNQCRLPGYIVRSILSSGSHYEEYRFYYLIAEDTPATVPGPNYLFFLLKKHPLRKNKIFIKNKLEATINEILTLYPEITTQYIKCCKYDLLPLAKDHESHGETSKCSFSGDGDASKSLEEVKTLLSKFCDNDKENFDDENKHPSSSNINGIYLKTIITATALLVGYSAFLNYWK
jgi:hypothetical protein